MTVRTPPDRASVKAVFINSLDTTDYLPVLWNPTTMDVSGGINRGNLEPVGWSQPVGMFGTRKSETFGVSLRFSQFEIWRNGYKLPTVQDALTWLVSFTCPRKLGEGSVPFIFIWPNVYVRMATLNDYKIHYDRFDQECNVRVADIELTMEELRKGFLNMTEFRKYGMADTDEGWDSLPGVSDVIRGKTGAVMNLGTGYDFVK